MGYRAAAALGFGPDSTLPDISTIPGISIIPGSIPGHEFIAEVVEVGEGVNDWKVGDRVVPGPGLRHHVRPFSTVDRPKIRG